MARLDAAIAGFTIVDVESGDFRVAGRLQTALAVAGLKGRKINGRKINGLLVAAIAMRLGVPVLHFDRGFAHVGWGASGAPRGGQAGPIQRHAWSP